MNKSTLLTLSLAVWGLSGAALAAPVVNQSITQAEVLAAQAGWCKALVDISTTGDKRGPCSSQGIG